MTIGITGSTGRLSQERIHDHMLFDSYGKNLSMDIILLFFPSTDSL